MDRLAPCTYSLAIPICPDGVMVPFTIPAFADTACSIRRGSGVCLMACCAVVGLTACNSRGDAGGNAARSSGAPDAEMGQPTAQNATQPLVVDGHAIISREAVGPLHLDTWRRPAMSFVYAIGATAGPHGEDMIRVRGIGRDTLTLMFANDTLRQIDVKVRGPHTVDGVGIGSSLDSLAGQAGARSRSAAGVRIVTLDRYCGVQFMGDTGLGKGQSAPRRVGSIIVGPCAARNSP